MVKFIIFLIINASLFSAFYFLHEFKEIYFSKEITTLFVSLPISFIIYSFVVAILDTFFSTKTINDLIKQNNKNHKKKNFKVIK